MTGRSPAPRSGGLRGREMPTIVWLMAGAGVWLAAVGATCALLTMTKRADAAAEADRAARGPRCWTLPTNDATGRAAPRVGAIAVGVREPRISAPVSAIAAGGPDPRRLRRPPGSVSVDRSSCADTYALYV